MSKARRERRGSPTWLTGTGSRCRSRIRPSNEHGVPLPAYQEPEDLYDYPDIYKSCTRRGPLSGS